MNIELRFEEGVVDKENPAILEAELVIQQGSLAIRRRLTKNLLLFLKHAAYNKYVREREEGYDEDDAVLDQLFDDYENYLRNMPTYLPKTFIKLERQDLMEWLPPQNQNYLEELYYVIPDLIDEIILELIIFLKKSFQADYIEHIMKKWRKYPFWEEDMLENLFES